MDESPDRDKAAGAAGAEDKDMGSGTIQKESGFRRFSDKLLYGACAATITLVGMVWSITWLQTEAKANHAIERVNAVEHIQQKHGERIIKSETLQEQDERQFRAIDDRYGKIDGKVESIQTTLNQVLLELRKGGK